MGRRRTNLNLASRAIMIRSQGENTLANSQRRRLLHVPIIHNQADMGGLGDALKRALVEKLDEQAWELNQNLMDQVWTTIETVLARRNLRYELVRIYQDGMPVCGYELRIVSQLARAGSRTINCYCACISVARRSWALNHPNCWSRNTSLPRSLLPTLRRPVRKPALRPNKAWRAHRPSPRPPSACTRRLRN